MRYTVGTDRLVMTCTPEERAGLREAHDADPDRFDSDAFLHELLENLVCNTPFHWIGPEVTGDLTDAPMLALLGDEEPGPDADGVGTGLVHVGAWPHGVRHRPMYQPVLYRWAFMRYAITSPQRELMESGQAVWDGGAVLTRPGQPDPAGATGEHALGISC